MSGEPMDWTYHVTSEDESEEDITSNKTATAKQKQKPVVATKQNDVTKTTESSQKPHKVDIWAKYGFSD